MKRWTESKRAICHLELSVCKKTYLA